MCGICGVYHPLEEGVDRTILRRMTDTMFHRGPDDEGLYVEGAVGLGARRLAIIDLSSAGHQPMSNEDGSKWIVHNGEIYNYIELRRDLQGRGHRFRSGTDTEVILHLYEEQGVQCLESLRGMFAFAIWDRSTRTLFAARDRLGIKPLYYHWDGSCFRFGSEIKAILADPRVRLEANPAGIAQYLRYMYVPGEATFYAGIRRLLPGHFLVVTPGRMAVEKYWDVQFGGDEQSEAHYIERFREILHEVVALHLRSDVPVGSHLSGGLDSSLLVGVASRSLGRPLKTFSARFLEGGQYDEGPYIRLVTDRFHTEHYEIVPTAASFAEILPKLMWLLDEPTVGPSVVPQYQVCELARRHVKVVLGGQGGDELFGGYYRYLLPALLDHARLLFRGGGLGTTAGVVGGLWRQVRTPEMRRFLEKVGRRRRTLALLNRDFRGQIRIGPAGDEGGRDGSGQGATDRHLGWDLRNYLPGLLHVEDRTSMAASIESRVPFLDHRLVEFAATIPPHVKLRRLVLKHVEREAARGILPDGIVERSDKIGFATPLRDWLKGPLKEPMADLLLAPTTRRRGIFDVARLERALRHHGEGRGDWSLPLWMAINIELWFRQCIER